MPNTENITFADACKMVVSSAAIVLDGHFYEVVKAPTLEEGGDALILRRLQVKGSGERAVIVRFDRTGNAEVGLQGDHLRMAEEHGDLASLRLVSRYDAPRFTTAETAAALMDAVHSDITRQDEGSDSAYEELYEVAIASSLGFPVIWSWIATMAEAASTSGMEAIWAVGDLSDFADCVQMAAQEFHNFITGPSVRDVADTVMTQEKAEELWRTALVKLVTKKS